MWRVTMSILAGVALAGGAAAAETSGEAPPVKCLTAEVNPVTGHVLCIDPLGAPVEAPPAEAMAPCKAEESRSGAIGRTARPCPNGCKSKIILVDLSATPGFGWFSAPVHQALSTSLEKLVAAAFKTARGEV